jgi:hypothetical protein
MSVHDANVLRLEISLANFQFTNHIAGAIEYLGRLGVATNELDEALYLCIWIIHLYFPCRLMLTKSINNTTTPRTSLLHLVLIK